MGFPVQPTYGLRVEIMCEYNIQVAKLQKHWMLFVLFYLQRIVF